MKKEPLVAICLAAYDPPPRLLRRQLQSLRAQTHRHWIGLVQDDASRPSAWRDLQRACAGDKRFRLARNPRNVGFYRNFETVLGRVPREAAYVALSDQDDVWRPDKLAALISALEAQPQAQLAYSDARICDARGRVIHPSFWVQRRNNHRRLDGLLVANSVPGAASLMRRSFLKTALPFPDLPGSDLYHDHWLACAALAKGGLAWVPETLYDYVQHGRNVLGHESQRHGWHTLRWAVRLLALLLRPWRLRRLVWWAEDWHGQSVRRISAMAEVLLERCPRMDPELRTQAQRIARLAHSLPATLAQYAVSRWHRLQDLGMTELIIVSSAFRMPLRIWRARPWKGSFRPH